MKDYYAKKEGRKNVKTNKKFYKKRMVFGANVFSISSYTSMVRIKNARLYV